MFSLTLIPTAFRSHKRAVTIALLLPTFLLLSTCDVVASQTTITYSCPGLSADPVIIPGGEFTLGVNLAVHAFHSSK